MKKTPKERYIRKVTQGLWILPRRQKEVRREVEEHLDDVADEQRIPQWTDELLARHFGSPKVLRKQFMKGGLPLWAKFLKLGCWSLLILLTLFVLFDLYMLWFFPLHPAMYEIARSDNPYFQAIVKEKGIPTIDIRWQEPGDTRSNEILAALKPAYQIIRENQKIREQARVHFLEEKKERMTAQGIVGATKEQAIQKFMQEKYSPEILAQLQQAQGMGMMGMAGMQGMDTALMDPNESEWLLEGEPNPFHPPLFPNEKLKEIHDLLSILKPSDEIKIPRPQVTEEDIEYMGKLIQYQQNPKRNEVPAAPESFKDQVGPMGMRPQWPNFLLSLLSTGKIDLPLKEQIQRAKDQAAANLYTFQLSFIVGELYADFQQHQKQNVFFEDTNLPISLLTVMSRWANEMTEAIHPQPEPLIDALTLQGITDNIGNMLRLQIRKISDIQSYRESLLLFSQTEIERMANDMPPWPDVTNNSLLPDITSKSYPVASFANLKLPMQLSRQPWFRGQCLFMQWILPNNSEAYLRYSILKNYNHIFLLTFVSPNIQKLIERYNVTIAKQRMALALLNIHQLHEQGQPFSDLPDQLDQWKDPFTEKGIQVKREGNSLSLISAGPNDQSVDIINGDNGKREEIVWTVSVP